MTRPGVLMVTGAYYPEVSGGGLQCRELVRTLRDRVTFTVVTTTADTSLATVQEVDGVAVYRVLVDVGRFWSKFRAALRLASTFVRLRGRFDLVHLHSFSEKSLLLILLAKLFRKKLMFKLTSVGYDDPVSIRRRGRLAYWFYRRADLFCGVSPRLQQLYHASGLPEEKFRFIPNGVDLERFRPVNQEAQRAIRRELEFPEELPLVLFVGFFSREKCPDLLFEAWTRVLVEDLPHTGLVFVGATRSRYHEVDPDLARKIRAEVQHLGVEKQVFFVEVTHEIEKYYRAANIFVLPSLREGLPNALLEAMASGLPCVASRLPGVTDFVIDHGANGFLFPPGDLAALENALRFLLHDPASAQRLGKKARETLEQHYSIGRTGAACLDAYQRLTRQSKSAR